MLPPAFSKHSSTPCFKAKLEIDAPVTTSTPSDWCLRILSFMISSATLPTPIVSRLSEVSMDSMRFLETVTLTVIGALCPVTLAV